MSRVFAIALGVASLCLPAAALVSGARPPVPLVDPDALDADDSLPETAQTLAVAARRSRSLTLLIDVA